MKPAKCDESSRRSLWNSGRCTLCGQSDLVEFLELTNVPAQDGLVWPTREEALAAPSGDIRLCVCRDCGYVGNRSYRAELVQFQGYDVSLEHSPLYQGFVDWLIDRLISRYSLQGKSVLEIACGKGHFLRKLCARAQCSGIGFDPSFEEESEGVGCDAGVRFVRDFYSAAYAQHEADLICCRQMLDIVDEPRHFLLELASAIRESPSDSVVFFEVPNAEMNLSRFVPWNIVYEHCCWFFPKTLALFFEVAGFEVLDVYACHEDEYIGIEARLTDSPRREHELEPAELQNLVAHLQACGETMREMVATWRGTISRALGEGKTLAAWGAGARAIGFLSALGIVEEITRVADINPRRQGQFLAGTGQKVVSPEDLLCSPPDVVIVTNPTYQSEIESQASKMGLACEFLAL